MQQGRKAYGGQAQGADVSCCPQRCLLHCFATADWAAASLTAPCIRSSDVHSCSDLSHLQPLPSGRVAELGKVAPGEAGGAKAGGAKAGAEAVTKAEAPDSVPAECAGLCQTCKICKGLLLVPTFALHQHPNIVYLHQVTTIHPKLQQPQQLQLPRAMPTRLLLLYYVLT